VLADADGSTILTVVAPSFEGLAWWEAYVGLSTCMHNQIWLNHYHNHYIDTLSVISCRSFWLRFFYVSTHNVDLTQSTYLKQSVCIKGVVGWSHSRKVRARRSNAKAVASIWLFMAELNWWWSFVWRERSEGDMHLFYRVQGASNPSPPYESEN
jgi:hypothetical protein